ncbi:MAG: hypothetical protein HMLKMBBP_03586 [Planctomycetes bacterium]|nr:hypothetical protein [Planctomycetota bacterium]
MPRLRRALTALLFLLAVFAAALPASAEGDVVFGIVTDAETRKPIAGARVALWTRDRAADAGNPFDWPKSPVGSTQTDASGRYTFEKAPVAPLRWVTVAAAGRGTRVVVAERGAAADAQLKLSPPWKGQLVRAGADGLVPAAGCEVLFFPGGRGTPFAGRYGTDAQGWISLPAEAGARIVVRGPGIATESKELPSPRARAVQLAAGGPVSGEVVDPSGRPVAGASVQLVASGPGSAAGLTDSAGRFSFDGVECGGAESPALFVSAADLAPRRVPVSGGMPPLRIELRRGVTIRGRVVDGAGAPVAGARVSDMDPRDASRGSGPGEDDVARSATSREDGSFELNGVPPEVRIVRAAGAAAGRGAAVLDASSAAEQARPLELTVRPAARPVRVRVVDRAGKPVAGVAVTGDERRAGVRTDADGVANVPAQLGAEGLELLLYQGPFGDGSAWASLSPAEAAADPATLTVLPGRELKLRPVASDGALLKLPLVTPVVALESGSRAFACTGVRDSGDAETVIVPTTGRFRVVVFAQGGPAWFGAIEGDAAKWPAGVADVPFPRLGEVRATVPDGFDTEVQVVLVPDPAPDELRGRLRTEKRFGAGPARIHNVAPGRWIAVAARPAVQPSVLAVVPFEIRAAGDVADLGSLKEPDTILRGVVKAAGRPVAGARVTFHAAPGCRLATTAGPDGAWAMRVPGDLRGRFTAAREGFGEVGRELAAPGGDFDLPPAAMLVLLPGPRSEPRPIVVRAGGAEREAAIDPSLGLAFVDGLAPGPFEVVVGSGPAAPTIRGEAVAGKVTYVDLAAK